MVNQEIHLIELTHASPEFAEAYDVIARDIPAEFLEEREFLWNRLRIRDEGPRDNAERMQLQEGYTLHLIVAKQGGTVAGAVYGHLISKVAPDNRGVGFVT